MPNNGWEKVGSIGVDAGLCWIGDPCYLNADNGDRSPMSDWSKFCSLLFAREKEGVATWGFGDNYEGDGRGVSVSTGYGDGTYDVMVRRAGDGCVAEVKVVFIPGEDDEVW